jgi:molybdopterin-biosynthesis enzyme MoeA-like protein
MTRADIVITTGGVGPTHDDITVPSIAKAFGRKLVREPRLERAIRSYYGPRTNDDVLRMADVPEGSELIEEPGLTYPLLRIENVYVFPGDPVAFKRKFRAWRERLRQTPFALRKIYLDADESEIAADLRAVENAHEVAIGSYPRYDGAEAWKVMITIEAKDPAEVEAAALDLVGRLKPGHLVRAEG